MLDLYEEEIPLLIKQVELAKRRARTERRLDNLELSSLMYSKVVDKRKLQQSLERELRETVD